MKIRIQHIGTRKFLRGIDTWTDSGEGARHFATSIEAFRHCVEHKLGGVNIIVDRGLARPPISIPVEIPACTGKPATGFPLLATK
ncbi:MAG TPA: hypothetical protein VGF13_18235 [Verrucomicrobiae bacterium]|jgi:hypothetical protein